MLTFGSLSLDPKLNESMDALFGIGASDDFPPFLLCIGSVRGAGDDAGETTQKEEEEEEAALLRG